MKRIKVFLRLGKRPHPLYNDLINYPPEGIDFKYSEFIEITSNKKISLFHKYKVKLWALYLKKNPPIAWINKKGCDLIHSTNNIMILNKTPWVMDVENIWGLMSFDPKNLEGEYFSEIKKVLSSKYCKALLLYTEAAKLSLINGGCEFLKSKMEVIYPAKKLIPYFEKPKNETLRILWAGRKFFEKGGNTVIQVFDKMSDEENFIFIIMGTVPEEIRNQYKNKKNIKFIDNKTHDHQIWEEFRKADIFLYPTNLDSYGLAMLDAMNHYTPIITSDVFSAGEIVKDGKNGFVISHPLKWHDKKYQILYPSFKEYVEKLKDFHNEKYITEITEKLKLLIRNKELRKEMGRFGREMIRSGKFSINERNKKLRKVYEEAKD